jgi:aryl-alcohol dehydrogenase-like predicted oxidoreductase
MQLTALGQTRLRVSRIGVGLAALGRPGYINLGHGADLDHDYDVGRMEARTHGVLDAAWAAGVRYFDAARSYGRAEAFLSSWLASRHIAPEQVTIGSKWGYTYTAGWSVDAERHEVKNHSLATLMRQIEESRALLGRHLDLYQIHSAALDSGVLEDHEVLTALAQLRQSGPAIGLTLSGPQQGATLSRALDITIDGERVFDSVQATWNLLEPSVGPALAAAHAAGLGVIVTEALANGRLTTRNTADSPTRALLERSAARLGTSLDALALAAAIAQPWADVVLSGAATLAQLESNLGALAVPWDDQAAAELHPLVEVPNAYWATRGDLKWN